METKQTTDFKDRVIETYEKVAVLGVTPNEAFKELLSAVSELVEECIGKPLKHTKHNKNFLSSQCPACMSEESELTEKIRQRFKERLK